MPAAAADESGPLRLLTTIYRQSWPPPAEGDGNESIDPSLDKRATRSCLWRGEERTRIGGNNKVTRPFSASLISPRREKKTTTRLMSARRSNASKLSDVKGLNASTFRKRTDTKGKIPEYDSSKVISDSAAARNRALAAEYIAMLSGRNYVKKQYREQYWQNEASIHQRPPSGRYIGERRHLTLYPDLGSVLGGQGSYVAGTAAPTNSPPRSAGPWRLSTSSASSGGKNHSVVSNGAGSEDISTVPDLGLAFRSKRSWSNIPSGKCYRVLSHPNDTLASLCLEGRSAASRASNSRTSSLSSTISMSGVMEGQYRLSSAGESSPSGSSDAISGQSRPCSGDEGPGKVLEFLAADVERNEKNVEINSDNEFHGVHGLPDSVFTEDENIENRNDIVNVESEDETGNDDEYDENVTADGIGRLSFSDLEESDISEHEADDYEEDEIDEDEVNRRLQQVSAVFDTANESKSLLGAAAVISPQDSDNESSYGEHSDCEDKDSQIPYQYAELLPHPYNECDLRIFATLPVGMDWRAFVQPDSQRKKAASVQRKNDTEKRRFQRGAKEREAKRRRSVEDTIDRLIMLEKMQALTVQYEQDKRRHLIHRAKARNAQKASSNNTQPNATPAQSSSTNNEVRPQSARALRRRSSTVSAFPTAPAAFTKPRKSQSSAELRNDAILNKSSPDLDLVRSSCTKNHLQYARRLSYSHRRRHRFGATLPRYYEYSWSERLPPSKRLSLSSLLYTKPRNCQQCRESDRRWAHVHTSQMILGRPRSAFSTFASEQQKLHQRPSTVSAITKNPDSNNESRSITNNRNQVLHGSPSRNQSTFGRPPPKPTSRDAQEKIFAARAVLSSVARDYVRAARRGGKHARRASNSNIPTRTGRSSPCGVVRYRKDARVLKTSVIDCTNLRLR